MGDYKDWTFKQRDHQRCCAEIPLITDTMLLLAVTPPFCPPPPQATIMPPHPDPSKLCKQPLLHANKGTKNASGASKRQGFPNPFLHFSVLKELPFLFFPSSLHSFPRSTFYARPNLYMLALSLFASGKNWFEPKLFPPIDT